mmetsp:Transcript_22867/g.54189  ORF Transcript_22867/g.54189 Transcript_22867/m.54189 type:complete len:700 (+) Transcript_22867:447-2546(+)
MMACRGDTTAMMCRDASLVDDTSTVYGNMTSDGETTINTTLVVNNEPFTNVNSDPGTDADTGTDGGGGGPGSIHHEHDLVNLVDMDSVDGNTNGSSLNNNINNNVNNQPESASEHSRLLTDDDDVSPEAIWAQHRHMMQMKQQQQQQQNPHYEPLDPEQDRSLQPASSWSKTLDGFVVGSNSNLKNNYNSFSGHESVSDRFYPNFDGGPHHDHHVTNQNGSTGNAGSYAFEMLGESQNICRSAGDAISHAVTNVFKLDGQRDTTALFSMNHEGGDVLGAIKGFIGNVNDQVDAVLIRAFNEQATETVQIDPNYSMYSGLDNSTMTGDTSFDLNEVTPLPSEGESDRRHHVQQLRAHQRNREVDVATPIAGFSPQVAATVINGSPTQQQTVQENVADSNGGGANNNSSDQKITTSEVAKQPSSATAVVSENQNKKKDEISTADLISASYDDDDGSVQRFKEQLYRSLGINIPGENGIKSKPVPEISQKPYWKTTESRDDDGGRPVVSSIVKAINKTAPPTTNVTKTATTIKSGEGKTVVDDDKRAETPTGNSSGGEVWKSFSELHKKRVMQLVEKNRSSSIDREIETKTTNQPTKDTTSSSSVIDLSYFDDSNVAEADSRDFVPLGKTGIVDFQSNKLFGGGEPKTRNNPEDHPDDAARDVSPSGMTPREEFRAMMKRLPKTFDSPAEQQQPEAIDLTMY